MTTITAPKDWASATTDDLRSVRGVCLDIDETLSTRGKLTAEAFSSLWALKNAGFGVVPITGRPAGWCDHFARFWPVDAVIGENGAFIMYMEHGMLRRLDTPSGPEGENHRARLAALGEKIRARFPKARWASDQNYRDFDLAIDICEDVPPWPAADVEALLELCAKEGAHAKLSSIHVNAWYGDYDKRRGMSHWLALGAPGLESGRIPMDDWLFIGDSPNDEPLFAAFRYAVGVANLRNYLPRLKNPPRWITAAESGAGFAEMARKLIGTREAARRANAEG